MVLFQIFRVTVFTVLALFVSAGLSLGADLAVEIKTTPDQDVLPLEVEFEAVVIGGTPPYSYTWNFGDGGSSTLAKDSHYYREAGQYTVRVTVFDSADGYGVASEKITVSASVFDSANTVFTTYSNTNVIFEIVQDRDDSNILWLGTDGGVVRLNRVTGEKKFYINELPHTYIHALVQTSDGYIWIGTGSGLVRFDYKTSQWTIYTYYNSGLPDSENDVDILLETSDGSLWVGTYGGGLARFEYKLDTWTTYNTSNSVLSDDHVSSLVEASDGSLWVGTHLGGLARFDYKTNQWTAYTSSETGLSSDDYVISLVESSDKAIWIATREDKLIRVDYNASQITEYVYNGVNSILESDGAIWIGTYHGLIRFDYETDQSVYYTDYNSSLPSNSVFSLVETTSGAIMAGTYRGLAWFDYKTDQWIVYTPSDNGLPDNDVQSLVEISDKTILIGTGEGLAQFNHKTNLWTGYTTGLVGNRIACLLESSDGSVWVGTEWHGLARLDNKTGHSTVYTYYNSGLPSDSVHSILESSDGAIWVGTWYGGLARFDYGADQWTVYTASDSGLPSNYVYSILESSDGAIWVGTGPSDGGLARFDYKSGLWTVYSSSNSELPDNWVWSLLESSDGAIWVGTWEGLARFNYKIGQWNVYTVFNSELPSNLIYYLLQSSDEAIWAGTNNGLARFDYKTDHWNVYTPLDSSLTANYVETLLETSDGDIWIGTRGLTRISFPSSSKSPGTLILIAGGGASRTNPLWHTTKELATTIYRIFNHRGFQNTDIYLITPEKWFDFNGDGFDDRVVDCPPANEDRNPTVEDIRYAITDWAVKTHTTDTPLYIYLIDHGYPDDGENGPFFMIAPGQPLYAADLNNMLNTYEQQTGGQVILINESCYSGQFLSHLKKKGRILITATSDKTVNYDNWGTNSFTHHFLEKIFENNSLHQAFAKASSRLKNRSLTALQTPMLDDNGDGKYDTTDGLVAASIKPGGDFTTGSPWPRFESVTQNPLTSTSTTFTANVNVRMKKVWAAVQPPGYFPDMTGDYQQISLEKFDLWDNDGDLVYEGRYEKFDQPGKYTVSLYAKDQFGNVALSDPIEIYIGITPGDVNNDGDVNIKDAIVALKIIAGISVPDADLNKDIGNNSKIGLEEAVFALQETAGINRQ